MVWLDRKSTFPRDQGEELGVLFLGSAGVLVSPIGINSGGRLLQTRKTITGKMPVESAARVGEFKPPAVQKNKSEMHSATKTSHAPAF
jgi:hypothetical protein